MVVIAPTYDDDERSGAHMSHELEMQNGKARFVSARGENAWHGLGTVVPGDIELRQFLPLAGLDNWNVTKLPLTVAIPVNWDVIIDPETNEPLTVVTEWRHEARDGRYMTIRKSDGKILGDNVGEQYHPYQAEDVLDLASYIVGGDDHLVPDTGGSLLGGTRFFLTFRIDGVWNLSADPHIPYLALISSHDGSLALTGMATPIRVVCNNTANFALRAADQKLPAKDGTARGVFKIMHRSKMDERRDEMKAALDHAISYVEAYQAEAERLMHTPIETRHFDLVLDGLFPIGDTVSVRAKSMRQKARSSVRSIYEASPEVGDFRGTAWGAIQAVNTHEQWVAPIHAKGRPEATVRRERQIDALLTDGYDWTEKTREILAGAGVG